MEGMPATVQTTPVRTAKRPAVKRPFGVTLVGVLLLVQGLLLAVAASAIIFLSAAPDARLMSYLLGVGYARVTVTNLLATVLVGVLGLFIVLSGVGVLRLISWAWLAAMALQGWSLALFLFDYFTRVQSGYRGYLSVLLSLVIVFYLNSRTVRRTFDLVRHRASAVANIPPAVTNITHTRMAAESEITSR